MKIHKRCLRSGITQHAETLESQMHFKKHSSAEAPGPTQHAHVRESAEKYLKDLPQTALALKKKITFTTFSQRGREGGRKRGGGRDTEMTSPYFFLPSSLKYRLVLQGCCRCWWQSSRQSSRCNKTEVSFT